MSLTNLTDYCEFEHNDLGLLKDKEVGQTMIQNTVMEALKYNQNKTKYVIAPNKILLPQEKVITKSKSKSKSKQKQLANPVKKREKEEAGSIEKMTKTFEDMMLQFQHMVQLNQLIQMNQMNQMQIMNQLIELKGNVIDTRQDLSFKLKEINQRIDEVAAKKGGGGSGGGGARSKKEKDQELPDNEDYSHLFPLKIENAYSLYDHRDIDENYVKNLLRSKNPSAFVKMFDLLYRCKDKSKKDIYPVRVIKAKTFQYYDEEGNWVLDTNGTNMMKFICGNIQLLFSKINNSYFEGEDLDMFDFVDNQTFIQELDDKKVRSQLLTTIRDMVVNHHMNRKPLEKENQSESI